MARKKKQPRCRGKTKAGKRCTRRAVKGNRCKMHPPKKGGRPSIVWDATKWRMFDAMCSAWGMQADIAEAMQTDAKTIDSICKREKGLGFSGYCKQKRGRGRALLAGKQLELAMNGNVVMCIWLGKQWLDQKEPPKALELSSRAGEGRPVPGIVVRFAPSPAAGSAKDEGSGQDGND